MKYKTYSKDIWDQVHRTLDLVLQQDSNPVAAFDADGTLWDTDLGEAFFQHIIDHRLVALPPNPWEYYETTKKDPSGPGKAYLWLAQILKGVKFATVQEWSQKAVQDMHPLPIFEEQKKMIELFQSRNVQVYIVTASVKWAVEPGAALLGLKANQVIGIETELENGVVTDKQKGLITYREGKAKAILAHSNGKIPFFSSGNTTGDTNLLQMASHLRLAVSATHPDDKIFKTEMELQKLAKESGWFHHRFV